MRIIAVMAIFWGCMSLSLTARTTVINLRTGYQTNPLGYDERPDFSWQMNADGRYAASQTAYRLQVADSRENLSKGIYVYDTQKQTSTLSVCIPYRGETLRPSTRYYWRVTVWDEKDAPSISSEDAWFETALLQSGWSGAQWISSDRTMLSPYRPLFVVDYDVQIAEGSHQAVFVFGSRDNRNYVSASIDLKGSNGPRFILSHTTDGKERIDQMQDISDLITAQTLHAKHHITIDATAADNDSRYDLVISIDGKDLRQAQYAAKDRGGFSVSPSPGDNTFIYARIYGIGFCQPQGQRAVFSGIRVSDSRRNFTFYTDPKTHDITGRGTLTSWMPCSDVAAPMLRKVFQLDKPIRQARLYATARGIYEVSINGKSVSHDFYNPGWTDYRVRIMYNTFDVTSLLRRGSNAIGAMIGGGWWNGGCGFSPVWFDQYGIRTSFLAKLVVTFADGSSRTIVTDPTWQVNDGGPVVACDMLNGEDYDARREMPGWTTTAFKAAGWRPASVVEAPASNVIMQAYVGQPVRIDEVRTAQRLTQPLPHTFVYDMGQNMVGVPRILLKGKRGQQVTVHFCEMTWPEVIPTEPVAPYTIEMYKEKHGQIYTDNYRSALSTDHYICRGDPKGEVFEPHFTQHGFRYLQITGIDAAPALRDVQVLVLNSLQDRQTATYETSDTLVNRLFSNILWGQKGNFLAVPTDCPQRDERLGWTGDAQIFSRTATYNRNVSPFYTRWLYSVRDDQGDDGSFSDWNPKTDNTPQGGNRGGAAMGWAEVGIILPWQVYQQYGNQSILEQSYNSMTRYMQYVERRAKDFIQPLGGYGDWVAMLGTQSDLTNTAWSAYDAQIMTKVAKLLGHDDDSHHYAQLFENIRQAFQKRYLDAEGYLISPAGSPKGTDSYSAAFGGGGITDAPHRLNTQTAYIMSLYMNLYPDSLRAQAARYLVDLLRQNGYCLNTGFIGTPYMNLVLSEEGYDEVAYRMLQQTAFPSWIYPILQGATTIWERWNSYTLKNGFGPVGMNSFNHYSYGAVEDWMMAYSAGIQRDEQQPGYKHILLQPRIGGRLNHVSGSFLSPYGLIESAWESDNREVTDQTNAADYGYTYTATVPANTSATLILPLPAGSKLTIEQGSEGIHSEKQEGGKALYAIGAGKYRIHVQKQ